MKKTLISFAATAVFASHAYAGTLNNIDNTVIDRLTPSDACEFVRPPLKIDATTCTITPTKNQNIIPFNLDDAYAMADATALSTIDETKTHSNNVTKSKTEIVTKPADKSAIKNQNDAFLDDNNFSVPKVISDTTSLSLKLDRYANNRLYREFVNDHATVTKKSGETSSLGQYKHYIAYWHAHIDRDFSLNMATGTKNLTAENPESPYFNENMKHIVECRDTFFKQDNATSVEPYNVYLEVHGCAKQRIDAAFAPFKDQAVFKSNSTSNYTNVEIDPTSVALKLAKVASDDSYEASVDAVRDQYKTQMALGELSTENSVRLFDTVLNVKFDATKLPKQDGESFSLNDHYTPHMNRQMTVLSTCQESLLPEPLATEDRKAVFTDIMACWQKTAETNYNNAAKTLENDPISVLSDTADWVRKKQRLTSSNEVYAPYKQAYITLGADMRKSGTINLAVSQYAKNAAFILSHVDPEITTGILYNYDNLDKRDLDENLLNQNFMHVIECRDQIIGDKKPAAENLAAKFQKVNTCAINAFSEAQSFTDTLSEMRVSNSDGETYTDDITVAQYKLLSESAYNSNITMTQLTDAGMSADGGEYTAERNENIDEVLACRDKVIPAKTKASDAQKQEIDQCLSDTFTSIAANENKLLAGLTAGVITVGLSLTFGGRAISGIRRRIRKVNDNKEQKRRKARQLSSN